MGSPYTESELKKLAKEIQDFIDANKHKIRFTKSYDLAPVIRRRNGMPYDLNSSTDKANFIARVAKLRRRGVLRYVQEVEGGVHVWQVNPAMLDKTGLTYHIPVEQPKLKSRNESSVTYDVTARMKTIRVSSATFITPHGEIVLHDVTLAQLYGVGLTLQSELKTEFTAAPQPPQVLPPLNGSSEEAAGSEVVEEDPFRGSQDEESVLY